MKTIFISVAATALLAFTTPAQSWAADAATTPNLIAVVNIQQVMREATAAQNVREQLETKQKTFQTEIAKKEDALQKEDADLGKKRSVLSKAAFDEKAAAFRKKATDVQKEVQSKKATLDSGFEHALNDIQKVVTDVISELAKEKGFSIAVPTSQILYGDPKLDISEEVLKRLNQKLPKLDVKFEAPVEPKADAAPAIPGAQ